MDDGKSLSPKDNNKFNSAPIIIEVSKSRKMWRMVRAAPRIIDKCV